VHARFRREALAAAQLSGHRNVVTVFDVGEHAGRPFIVMELLDGGSVHDRLRRGPVNHQLALRWLGEAADALDAAHARGIVHRDVKPANLLLDGAETVHVSDFGIASTAGFDTITLPGTVLGTAGYMAPEQARGESATAATDRYALGVVAFELLTGRRPYAADTPVTEALAHVNAEVPKASRVQPSVPASVDAVLARSLAKDPSRRHPSSRALVADLRSALEEAEAPTLVHEPTSARRYRRGHERRPAYVALLAALLIAGIGSALVVASMGDGSPRRGGTQPPAERSAADAAVGETTKEPAPPGTPEPSPQPDPPPPPPADAAQLNDDGYTRMLAGDYTAALPLFEEAVSELQGSGSLAEAYASYNLAFSRFALGGCEGVLVLLERSEIVQGRRKEIDRLRHRAEKGCLDKPGRGNGRDGD
jgi:serine/threonine-protein kinase